METKEKKYTLKISETELRDPKVKDALVRLIKNRIRMQKNKNYLKISGVEYLILNKHYSWANVELYTPKKKDRMPNELGKFNGQRCVLVGKL